jgi:pimeloyl-ACP methyl ester carboxylesterase
MMSESEKRQDESQQEPLHPEVQRVPHSEPDLPKPTENQSEPVYGPNSHPLPDTPVTPTSPRQAPQAEAQIAQQPIQPARTAVGQPGGRGGAPARTASPTRGRIFTIHYNLSYLALNAEAGGQGAIVLLHDLPGGAYVWQPLLPALAATGRAVYAFDMLGYGESDHPWPSDTTVWGHADNLAPALRALGLHDIVLVGLGVGGGVTQVLATRMYREEIGALVLINTYAYNYAYAPDWPMTQMERRHDPDAPRSASVEQALADLRQTLPNGSANPKYLAGSALDAYVSPWNSHLGEEMLFQHIRQMLPDYILSVASDLKRLSVPAGIIWGEQDTVTPIMLGQRLARDIPGAGFATVRDAGHLILDDAPDRVGALLTEFAGRVKMPASVASSAR